MCVLWDVLRTNIDYDENDMTVGNEECSCERNEKHSINFNVEFKKVSPAVTKIICTRCKGVIAWIEDEHAGPFKDQYDTTLLEKWR